jgi:m7GpppX diphosphatase
MRVLPEQQLLVEKQEHYEHPIMQQYIQGEVTKPTKQWIISIINGTRETECIKLETDDFVLLPDTERTNRFHRGGYCKMSKQPSTVMNWLGIVKNCELRTIRDLRGSHVDMLTTMKEQCIQKIHKELGINPDEIMAYIHYHPSVYQLHVHFAYPYMQHNHRDIYRIHPVDNIINNLQTKDDYYASAALQVSCSKESLLYKVIKTSGL